MIKPHVDRATILMSIKKERFALKDFILAYLIQKVCDVN